MRRIVACLTALAALAGGAVAPAQARTVQPLPADWQRGANVVGFRWDSFSGPAARKWLVRLRRSARADYAVFVTRWFQYHADEFRRDDVTATEIHPSWGDARACARARGDDRTRCQTPALEETVAAMREARRHGLRVVVKPLVDVGRTDALAVSRAEVDLDRPDQRRRWFDAYKAMLSRYVRIARDVGADTLVVGTGLNGMTDDPEDLGEWRAIVDDIRSGAILGDGEAGYQGRLTYGAPWDTLFADAGDPERYRFFWDALDFIGVEGFWPLVSARDPRRDDPPVSALREGWTFNFVRGGMPAEPTVRALHAEYGKPVLFTGLGYLSRGGTALAPWKADAQQRAAGGRLNLRTQQRAYRAAFDFWASVGRRRGWFRGIWWWNWNPAARRLRNGDYSPQGKPAERELCLRHAGRLDRRCRPSAPVR